MRRLLMIFALSCLLWGALPAQACSGGADPVPLLSDVENAALIVEGEVRWTDRWGKNFIFEVDRYLKGDGPRRLLVQRVPAARSRGYYEAKLDFSCAYDSAEEVQEGQAYTLFLSLNVNATTSTRLGRYYDSWNDYRHDSGELGFLVREGDTESVSIRNAEEFRVLIDSLLGEGHRYPDEPKNGGLVPLFTPLYARTTDGIVYLLPVTPEGQPYRLTQPFTVQDVHQPFSLPDMFQPPPLCRALGCELRSADGVYGLWRDEEGLRFDSAVFSYMNDYQPEELKAALPRMTGQVAMFAPSSDAFAVWDGPRLSLWAIGRIASDSYTGLYYPAIYALHELEIQAGQGRAADWQGLARWSADGNVLAYEDAEGIWLMDVYGTDGPRLILSEDQRPVGQSLLAISSHGRYVAYGTPQGWTTYDHAFGVSWPNALISPNERYRLNLDAEQLRRPLLWIDDSEYITLDEGWARNQRADGAPFNRHSDALSLEIEAPAEALLAYTPYGRSTAIQTGERQISIQHRPFYQMRFEWTFDLPGDSAPLEALWWGAPYFVPVERYPN